MIASISHVTLLVHDQDEALQFYTEKLGFEKDMDVDMGENGRWLTVNPTGKKNMQIALMKATSPEQQERIGKQVGDSVLLVVLTDDINTTYTELKARGVTFRSEPTFQGWGTEAVFEDLYGNRIDLVQVAR